MSRQDNLRKEILFQLYGVRPIARGADAILRDCRKQQMDFTRQEIWQELQFLADENLLIPIDMSGTTEKLYRISAAGVRHYEQTYAP